MMLIAEHCLVLKKDALENVCLWPPCLRLSLCSFSGEFGLWLDGDLYHGRSHSCKTFGNPMLSKKEDFYVQDIEIWAFE